MRSNFDTVIGQRRAKEILISSLRHNRISHAYLLWGSEGVGKDALAIEFARALLCEKGTESACGECGSCKKMMSLQHPNLTLVFPTPGSDSDKSGDGDTMETAVLSEVRSQIALKAKDPYRHIDIPRAKFIRISSIRGLKKESSLSNVESGRKVFLLFDAETMNDAAANSLLKILEEPLEGTHFVLTTARVDLVKETIRSRCHHIHCSSLSDDEIAAALVQREHIDEARAGIVARLSNGSFRRAQELLGDHLQEYRSDAVKLLRIILGNSPATLLEELDGYLGSSNRDDAEQLIIMLLAWFRDAIILRERMEQNIINVDQQDDLERFLKKFGDKDFEQCLLAAERALELLRRNVYLSLVLLSFSVQIRHILNAK